MARTPETEAEMTADSLLSSHRAGQLLQVNPSSINKWVEQGRIPAFRTPGGHRRIRALDLVAFLREHEMPVPAPLEGIGVRRLLWVDDDETLLKSVRRHLSKLGDQVLAEYASNGIDAMVKVGAFRPNVIVLDIVMPELDGIEVCERLKASPDTRDIDIIIVSGQTTGDAAERAMKAGARVVFNKPVKMADVLAELSIRPATASGR